MSAYEVLDNLLIKLEDDSYTFYVVNFANPDMIGHTGNYEAAVKAMEYLDECIGKLQSKCLEQDIAMLITADHGNCDQMIYPDGSPHTSHSDSAVPFALVKKGLENVELEVNNPKQNALKDVAPTVLHLLGLEKPKEFQGHTIFE